MINWKRSTLGLAFVIIFTLTYYIAGGDIAAKIKYSVPQEQRNTFDSISREFINAAYSGDESKIKGLLANGATYIKSPDGSSVIIYDDGKTLVEGYMSTDKKLMSMRQKWHIAEDDGTYVSCMEVYVKGESLPETWNIYFTKEDDEWKVVMLENGI